MGRPLAVTVEDGEEFTIYECCECSEKWYRSNQIA